MALEVIHGLLFLAALSGFTVGFLAIWLRPSKYEGGPLSQKPNVSVQIVVLGDIGHSPRMQYHALSIAKHGGSVCIIGYNNSTPHPEILANPSISILPLPSPPAFLQTRNRYIFPFLAALKLLHQTWCLWFALAYRSKAAKWMLVQNPPAAPTLVLAQLACFLRNTRLIIDWHNFGHTILALKLGSRHPMVQLMKRHEMFFCRFAHAHFCVSNAMARMLREDGKIKKPLLVLHDRPPPLFQPIWNEKEHFRFLSTLPETSDHASALKNGESRLLVSSTSWTPDEDFSLLVDVLCRYSALISRAETGLPPLCVIITGKGPQREMYMSKIESLRAAGKLEKITIKSAWLSLEDYAKLLACASLGVSLHTSSSGVDLPMKVVDMFGAGLPVVGWCKYEAWPELVTEDVNGLGFGSADELLSHLTELFSGDGSRLAKLRKGALRESGRRWNDEWDLIAGKLLQLTS